MGGMPRRRKTWREKFEARKEPEIVDDPRGRGKMLIPTPRLIDSLIRKVPRGRLVTVDRIRERLAEDFHVDLTCPLATGWFIRIVAEAAEEERKTGATDITPYWRVIRRDGSLIEKFPGGGRRQASLLRGEGHTIQRARNTLRVKDYERSLITL